MLEFLNEVLIIEDLEPDAYQMGISGKSNAKVKSPSGGKAGVKGDFNAMHPRYPKGHPSGGKFMPKGSKDQIKAIAKNTGQSVEKVAAAVGGKAPANKAGSAIAKKSTGKLSNPNYQNPTKEERSAVAASLPTSFKAPKAGKGKLTKFAGSAGAVGKAQKVLKNKESTPEQRAKAKASIAKAAGKMRGDAPAIAEKPKRGRISNKEIMARNAGTSAPTPTGSMTSSSATQKREKLQGKLDKMNKRSMDIRMKEGKSEAYYKNQEKSDKYAGVLEGSSMSRSSSPAAAQKAIANSIARNKAKTDSTAKAARKESAYKNSPKGKAEAKERKAKVERNVVRSQIARDPSMNWLGSMGEAPKRSAKSVARNQQKKAKDAKFKAKGEAKNQAKLASSLESKLKPKFGAQSANIAKNQAILKSKSSTPDQRAKAKRLITLNAKNAKR
jgi:hypothetical protein